jgi:quercetin dioxygenase-like cupin family protein
MRSHPETNHLVFLEGEMAVLVGENYYPCQMGDRFVIASNVEHSDVVGPMGCVVLCSERL